MVSTCILSLVERDAFMWRFNPHSHTRRAGFRNGINASPTPLLKPTIHSALDVAPYPLAASPPINQFRAQTSPGQDSFRDQWILDSKAHLLRLSREEETAFCPEIHGSSLDNESYDSILSQAKRDSSILWNPCLTPPQKEERKLLSS